MTEARIQAGYRVRVASDQAEDMARRIAYEQTVELPIGQVTDSRVLSEVVARIEDISSDPDSADHQLIRISHRVEMANGQLFDVAAPNSSRPMSRTHAITWEDEVHLDWDPSSAMLLNE